MDWKKGILKISDVEPGSATRITICSDWAPRHHYEQLMINEATNIYGDLLPLIKKSDLSIVNVETVLGDKGEAVPKGGPNLKGSEEAVQSLLDFDIACLANNHTMDFGPEGLEHTINVLREAGLETVGAGPSGEEAALPLIKKVKNIQVGIINCAEGEECRSVNNEPGVYGIDVHRVSDQVKTLKESVDIVLVIFHGGREHIPSPPLYVVNDLRSIADAGADAIIAHHPHVPQGIEQYHGVPIVYSQGNFVFWQNNNKYFNHTGYMVHLDVSNKKLFQVEITPYKIMHQGLQILKGDDREEFMRDIQYVSGVLEDRNKLEGVWNAVVDEVGFDAILESLEHNAIRSKTDTKKGAAWLHNILFTSAHRELYLNALKRTTRGEMGNSPDWAKELVQYWKKSIKKEQSK